MSKIKGYMFDENGQRIDIDNVDIFVGEMKDRLLISTYKATIYQHALTQEMEALVKKGLIKRADSIPDYDFKLTENSIRCMKLEVIERFDKKFHEQVVKSIDLSFLDKKPKNL